MIDTVIKALLLPVLGYLATRAFVAVAQAFGWHPEKKLEKYAKKIVGKWKATYRRWRQGTPPVIENAPGMFWRRLKDGDWQCQWQASSPNFEPRRIRLWRGKGNALTDPARRFIVDQCLRLQDECNKECHKEPTMEEILASIRRIIAEDAGARTSAHQA